MQCHLAPHVVLRDLFCSGNGTGELCTLCSRTPPLTASSQMAQRRAFTSATNSFNTRALVYATNADTTRNNTVTSSAGSGIATREDHKNVSLTVFVARGGHDLRQHPRRIFVSDVMLHGVVVAVHNQIGDDVARDARLNHRQQRGGVVKFTKSRERGHDIGGRRHCKCNVGCQLEPKTFICN
jgi:hypothetical protein